jgi:hypothetical protein
MAAVTSHALVDKGIKYLNTLGKLLDRRLVHAAHLGLDSVNQVMPLIIHDLVAQVTLLLGAVVADDLENLH